jgi:hypothetical protein
MPHRKLRPGEEGFFSDPRFGFDLWTYEMVGAELEPEKPEIELAHEIAKGLKESGALADIARIVNQDVEYAAKLAEERAAGPRIEDRRDRSTAETCPTCGLKAYAVTWNYGCDDVVHLNGEGPVEIARAKLRAAKDRVAAEKQYEKDLAEAGRIETDRVQYEAARRSLNGPLRRQS